MKKRLRFILLLASAAAIFGFALFRLHWENTTLLEARLVSEQKIAQLQAGQDVGPGDCVLHWNGAVLPFDSARGAYALPQVPAKPLQGALSTSWGTVYLPADVWNRDLTQAMEKSELLPIYVSDGSRWCKLAVYLSGLPAISIKTVESTPIYRDPEIYGASMNTIGLAYNDSLYTMFWPQGNSRQHVVQGRLEWHWRGNAGLFYNKKSYRINLLDSQGESKRENLAGLGDDSNWILLSMATDSTRTRDKLCWQLWRDMVDMGYGAPYPAMEIQYTELYLNDTYLGVYGLCRPVSGETLGLSQADRFYKWRKNRAVLPEEFDEPNKQQRLALGSDIDVIWPKLPQPEMWSPLKHYVENLFYPELYPENPPAEESVDLNNMIDTAIFKQFICGADNVMQNQLILWKNQEKKFYRLPWDMDYSFGNLFTDLYYLGTDGEKQIDFTTTVLPDLELDTLWQENPEKIGPLLAERWQKLRSTVLTEENVAEKMNALQAELIQSGAWQRDNQLWGEAKTYDGYVAPFRTLNVQQTLDELHQRLLYLDHYMADYRPPSREIFNVLPQ